jgi:hypothetical protein
MEVALHNLAARLGEAELAEQTRLRRVAGRAGPGE